MTDFLDQIADQQAAEAAEQQTRIEERERRREQEERFEAARQQTVAFCRFQIPEGVSPEDHWRDGEQRFRAWGAMLREKGWGEWLPGIAENCKTGQPGEACIAGLWRLASDPETPEGEVAERLQQAAEWADDRWGLVDEADNVWLFLLFREENGGEPPPAKQETPVELEAPRVQATQIQPPPPAKNRKTKGTVHQRMLEAMAGNPERTGWKCRQWAEYLKCSRSTVVETGAWKALVRGGELAKGEHALDRHRKPKGRRRGG